MIYTVAIIGVGSRGGDTYGRLMQKFEDKFKIVSLCERREQRLERFASEFGVDKSLCFTDENEFFKERRADLLVVATQDADHVRHAVKAFELGYDLLLEKPITASREECNRLLEAQKKSGKQALVCHVLRYAPAFTKCAEIIDDGSIGRLVCIDEIERVCYWHQAHSYVRGNWRRTEDTTPMILAKCCHDLDLLQYYAKSKCVSVSSVGDLTFFNEANAPEGCADRCLQCKYSDSCPYSAKTFYVEDWKNRGCPEDCWPGNVIAPAPVNSEKLLKAVEEGPYGRCVFKCDNNAVDHQITQMTFENGVKATLTMTAFTAKPGRRFVFHGTMGELVMDEEVQNVTLRPYGKPEVVYPFSDLIDHMGFGHGGGDYVLIEDLYDMIQGKTKSTTSLDKSVESHLMGIAAEESRLQGGALVKVHQ